MSIHSLSNHTTTVGINWKALIVTQSHHFCINKRLKLFNAGFVDQCRICLNNWNAIKSKCNLSEWFDKFTVLQIDIVSVLILKMGFLLHGDRPLGKWIKCRTNCSIALENGILCSTQWSIIFNLESGKEINFGSFFSVLFKGSCTAKNINNGSNNSPKKDGEDRKMSFSVINSIFNLVCTILSCMYLGVKPQTKIYIENKPPFYTREENHVSDI